MDSFTEKAIRPSWKHSWHLFLLCILILPLVWYKPGLWWLWVVLFGLLPIGYAFVIRQSTLLTIRNDELTLETGLLSRNSTEVKIRDIKTIDVQQSLVHRMLDIGRVRVATAGTEGWEITIEGVEAPNDIRNMIQKLQG